MQKYIKEVLKLAKKAKRKHEIPVGAIIVSNGKIISKAYNLKEKTKISTNHAEIIAINKANRVKKTWRLNDCIMIVSLEPCMMCAGAILESRIKKVYCITRKQNECSIEWMRKNGIEVELIKDNNENLLLLQSFFGKKR